MAETIGLIGAGSMGGPIGANLLAHGHALVVHDIDAAAVGRLTAAGARSVVSAREVADSAPEVLVCLPSLEAIRTVALGPRGLVEGTTLQTFVNFSTTGPAFVREIAAALARSKVTVLDCPITGGAARAAEGTLS